MKINLCLFLLLFAYTVSLQGATVPPSPNLQTSQTFFQNIKTAKLLKKSLKKMRRSGFAGYEAIGYIIMFLTLMLLVGIAFALSLIFKWTIAAWILGIFLGIQALIVMFYWISAI